VDIRNITKETIPIPVKSNGTVQPNEEGLEIVMHLMTLSLKRLEALSNFHLPLKQLWGQKKKKAKKKVKNGIRSQVPLALFYCKKTPSRQNALKQLDNPSTSPRGVERFVLHHL
jgi:hypothetical protein